MNVHILEVWKIDLLVFLQFTPIWLKNGVTYRNHLFWRLLHLDAKVRFQFIAKTESVHGINIVCDKIWGTLSGQLPGTSTICVSPPLLSFLWLCYLNGALTAPFPLRESTSPGISVASDRWCCAYSVCCGPLLYL